MALQYPIRVVVIMAATVGAALLLVLVSIQLSGRHNSVFLVQSRKRGSNEGQNSTSSEHSVPAGRGSVDAVVEAFYQDSQNATLEWLNKNPTVWNQSQLWFLLAPFHVCPRRRRIGNPVDGGKWICDAPLAPDFRSKLGFKTERPCHVYSLGSSGWVGFEEAILKLYPHCAMHTFDHTLNEQQTQTVQNVSGVTFHPLGITSNRRLEQEGPKFTSVSKSMGDLGIVWLDILKMDIEGAEWGVFLEMLDSEEEMPFTQILVEIHTTFGDHEGLELPDLLKRFFMGLWGKGYRIFNVEPNFNAKDMNNCFEFSFIKTDDSGRFIRPYPSHS